MGIGLKTIATAGVLFGFFSCYKFVDNIATALNIDKKIGKVVELAGATTTIGAVENDMMSMESLLREAVDNAKERKGENSAIWYKSDVFEIDRLIEVLEVAKQHAYEVGILDHAYTDGYLADDAPEWIRITYDNCVPAEDIPLNYHRLFSSELGAITTVVYETLNDAVSGDAQPSDDRGTTNMALVSIMERAADKAWWNPIDTDYIPMCNAWGNTYFALIYSNMGKLDKAIELLEDSKNILDQYPDDTDLAIVCNGIKTLTIGDLKKSVGSGIYEFKKLNEMPDDKKYTQGWWGQIQKKSESLGASDVFIGDLINGHEGRYETSSILWLLSALASFGLAFGVSRNYYF